MKPIGTFRRKFGKFILIGCITGLLGWGAYWFIQWAFTIRAIEVVGDNAQVIIDEKRISRNLLFFPSEILRVQVLGANPWLSDVRFEKKFPGTLRIIAVLRQPIAIVASNDRIVLVDRDGVVVSDGDGGNSLPRVIIDISSFRVGDTIGDGRVRMALSLITALTPELYFSSITQENGASLRAKSNTLDIIVAQDRPIDETLATLQMLLAGFRIKGTLPAVVDLRFDKPIVTF